MTTEDDADLIAIQFVLNSSQVIFIRRRFLYPLSLPKKESWIEVTPQILGYQPFGIATAPTQQPSGTDLGSFHTNVEEILLTRLLNEAQDISDLGVAAPPSPPPSRECVTPSEHDDFGRRWPLPPDALLYAAALKASSLSNPVTTGPGEWASRPEVGGFLSVVDRPDVVASPSLSTRSENPPQSSHWSLRHSALMKSRLLAWLIDHVPDFLSHAATFLLGAATRFMQDISSPESDAFIRGKLFLKVRKQAQERGLYRLAYRLKRGASGLP
ncbi:hypothetical protein X801_03766, partial [Opisthorchis viverrini]